MITEIYKDYLVTEQGEVFSTKREYPKVLKQSPNTNGHPSVVVRLNNKTKVLRVATMVAETYLDKRNKSFKHIIHLDGDITNNDVSNLLRSVYKANESDDNGITKTVTGYRACVNLDGKRIYLSTYDTKEQAEATQLGFIETLIHL